MSILNIYKFIKSNSNEFSKTLKLPQNLFFIIGHKYYQFSWSDRLTSLIFQKTNAQYLRLNNSLSDNFLSAQLKKAACNLIIQMFSLRQSSYFNMLHAYFPFCHREN